MLARQKILPGSSPAGGTDLLQAAIHPLLHANMPEIREINASLLTFRLSSSNMVSLDIS